jgi:hypothetical protein
MMIKRLKIVAMLAIGALALGEADLARAADANPPEWMTYQGYLVDGNGAALGNSVPANYDIVFRIYDVKQGGVALWAEQQTVTVDKGYFSVLLGEGSDFGNENRDNLSSVFSGDGISDRFIGVTVDTGSGNIEIAPRLRLVASPYAYTATQARRLTDASGNSNFFKDGSSLKLGAGATTTLTLPEAGGATLVGKLTADLAGWGLGLQIDNGDYTTTLGAGDVNSFNLSTSLGRFSFNKPLETSTIYLSNDAGLTATSGDYGSVMTTGSGNNGNDGYSIGGRYNFMANGDNYVGTYNDLDNEWLWLYDRSLDRHVWHSDGGHGRLYLDSTGLTVVEELRVEGMTSFFNDVKINSDRLEIGTNKALPKLLIDSTSGGDDWTSQGAQITIGESGGDGGAAAMNMTYRGDGYGWVGAGSISNGEPSGGHVRFHYTGGATIMNRPLAIYQDTTVPYLQLFAANGEYTQWYRDANSLMLGLNGSHHNSGWRYALYNGDSNWDFGSDRRLKENINDIEPVLDRLLGVQVRRFKWKGAPSPEMTDIGVIAQELEPLFPGLISKSYSEELKDDAFSVGYTTFGILAVKGLQELKDEKDAENESLKQEVETLKSEVEVLKARLANSTTQEDRIAKLEELVSKIGQGE